MTKGLKFSIIIFTIFLLVFGYWVYDSKREKPENLEAVSNKSMANINEEEKIIQTLNTLKSIDIDSEFFSNNAFRSLVDFSHELVPEAVGRPNPFVQI